MRKLIFPLLLGIAGLIVLIGLGIWQVQRLAWKTDILADITSRISAAPVALPANADAEQDRYLPVTLTGTTTDRPLFVLVSPEGFGAGYRLISAFETSDNRRVLVDLGWVPLETLDTPPTPAQITITGNLHWPDEVDSWTPPPDPSGIWFARDVPAMASALNTEPVMIVARRITPQTAPFQPIPLDTSDIKNDHLTYAITWFLLALGWAAMTGLLIYRTTRPKDAA